MKIAVLSFTKKGAHLNQEMSEFLETRGDKAKSYSIEKYANPLQIPFSNVRECVDQIFGHVDALIFIGATGIAVRSIAPHVIAKDVDPAVLVIDETMQFVIPLLSGHIGGANQLARELAGAFFAKVVLTTATDCNQVFAVDTFAVQNQLWIRDVNRIKEISSALLDGKKIGFFSAYPVQGALPDGLDTGSEEWGIFIGEEEIPSPFKKTFYLHPKNIVIGIGCKRGTKKEALWNFLTETLRGQSISKNRINRLASIDKKADEEGLCSLANELDVPIDFYTSEQLSEVQGTFDESDFVKQTVGVGNVCERSACLSSGQGQLILKKQSRDGMTLSIWAKQVTLCFDV